MPTRLRRVGIQRIASLRNMKESARINTQIERIDSFAPNPASIALAAAILRGGGLVAFPTETVYGLGANALDAIAVERIFTAKGRPAYDPLIVHVSSVEWLPRVAVEIPALAHELAERFWPGPLTLVMRRTSAVPNGVTAGGETVAVRAPNHAVAQALLRASNLPIAAPSANRFGHTSPTTAQHVLDDLDGSIDMILDGGATTIGVESTVLDLTVTPPAILRHGGVTAEALREVIGQIAERTARVTETEETPEVLASPGMLDRHYAPRTPLTLFRGEGALDALLERGAQMQSEGLRVCALALDEDLNEIEERGWWYERLGSESDLAEVARTLYFALRQADARGAEALLVREPRGGGIGAAIRDRLTRAAKYIVTATR